MEIIWADGGGFFGMPNFIEGFDQTIFYKDAMASFRFPSHVFGTRERVIEFGMRNYWTKKDFDQLLALTDNDDPFYIMREALLIAREILSRSPKELGIVCGPISSGKYSVEQNLRIFARTVFKIGQKMPIFNQLPFEPVFHKAHQFIKDDKDLCPNGSSSNFFIDQFYEPLFRLPGMQWLAHFIFGWKHSTGSNREYQIFTELQSGIHELLPGFEQRLL